MKLPELKKRFQNKYVIRIAAGVLTVALAGSGVMIFDGSRSDSVSAEPSVLMADTGEKITDDLDLESFLQSGSGSVDKEEMVYLISDATGKVDETIVMNHLYNKDKADSITDKSGLSGIENVKGKETFTQNGEDLTWQAGGNDIYYRGTTDKEAPVTQKVTYYLDGSEISPEELAGKSGIVRIRFDYTNTTGHTVTVNGKEQQVCVPFAAVTGMILNNHFSKIEVVNGRVKTIGDKSIVIGYALPGLKDSLGVERSDFTQNIEMPEYVEIVANVKKFSLDTAMTVVVNPTDLINMETIDTTSLDELVEEISDAADSLENGSSDLAGGLDTLDKNMTAFVSGMKELQEGLAAYTKGAKDVNGGITQLKNGIGTLNRGKKDLANGVTQLKNGADSIVNDGTKALLEGFTGTKTKPGLVDGSRSLSDGASQLAGGLDDLLLGFEGSKKEPGLSDGMKSLADGIDALVAGIETGDKTANNPGLLKGTKALSEGAAQLDAGVDELARKLTQELPAGTVQGLQTKMTVLNSSAGALMTAFGFASGVTLDPQTLETNAEEIANALMANQEAVVTTIAASGGVSEAAAKQTYAQILAGLYEFQGAADTAKATITTLSASADDLTALTNGSEQLKQASAAIYAGVGTLDAGAKALDAGSDKLFAGIKKAHEGVKKLESGSNSLSDGAKSAYEGTKKLYEGTKTVSGYMKKLDDGMSALFKKMPTLTKGIGSLDAGAKKLAKGSSALISNNEKIMSGIDQLVEGTDQMDAGIDKLADGSVKLADGIAALNEKAVDKMIESYNGDVKTLLNSLQAVLTAGNEYQSYSSKADGAKGSVKFIYKLASIEEKK